MPLVQAKCTNCGANLEVDNTKDAAVCPYCGTPYVVEKAINNYNVTNTITAGTVNVFGGNSADFIIRGGVLEKYTGASLTPVIPNSVVEIRSEAFINTRITNVTIPDSVTEIGAAAFENCTGLTSVTIPNSVTKIGFSAFKYCTNLSHLTISNANTDLEYLSGDDYDDGFPFTGCPIGTIIAPEEWKRKHWRRFDCLKHYAPPPPPPPPEKKEGCYIATAVYGSYDAPEVRVLRRYRDEVLQHSLFGRTFIRTYYFLSPPVAERLKHAKRINGAVRRVLDGWVERLSRKM